MKQALLSLLFLGCLSSAFATIHNVAASGGPGLGTPIYSPQFITINQNDTVRWTWVSGQHNVTSTSGPATFASGNHLSPFVWSFKFTLAGFYNYKCTIGTHGNTQFGTITVNTVVGLTALMPNWAKISPNPFVDMISITLPSFSVPVNCRLVTFDGKQMGDYRLTNAESHLPVGDLPNGVYFLIIENEDLYFVKKILK